MVPKKNTPPLQKKAVPVINNRGHVLSSKPMEIYTTIYDKSSSDEGAITSYLLLYSVLFSQSLLQDIRNLRLYQDLRSIKISYLKTYIFQ